VPLVVLHLALIVRVLGDASGLDRLWQAGGVGTVVALLLLPITAIASTVLPAPPSSLTAQAAPRSAPRPAPVTEVHR
jgi:hypothetical protein